MPERDRKGNIKAEILKPIFSCKSNSTITNVHPSIYPSICPSICLSILKTPFNLNPSSSLWQFGVCDLTSKIENVLVFEKSKWIRKQKLTSNLGFFYEFLSQLILTTAVEGKIRDLTLLCIMEFGHVSLKSKDIEDYNKL